MGTMVRCKRFMKPLFVMTSLVLSAETSVYSPRALGVGVKFITFPSSQQSVSHLHKAFLFYLYFSMLIIYQIFSFPRLSFLSHCIYYICFLKYILKLSFYTFTNSSLLVFLIVFIQLSILKIV